ncbi:CD63 antigen-like [Copidosoma floridanum]|uniref:CD63 antigen-like n=1 Tax=Copidosoma floridanum TaxID=29053 RepID=UPI0006C9845A|nr:CD63 antigen-like [Copidosoma floridanum]
MAGISSACRGGRCKTPRQEKPATFCISDSAIRTSAHNHRGWETRFGCCAAVSLSVLEVKRLLLLTLEMLMDSRPIRFAGALVPIVLSFADSGLGFPIAIATLYAIRRHQARPCYPKQGLRRVALLLMVCVVLNVVTVWLIAGRVNVRTESLRDAFRAAMRLYTTRASYKLALDELQLDLECCGSLAYTDWFAFDWQVSSDYDEPEALEYGERSVPFSCCRRRTMLPCAHTDMRRDSTRTINCRGCALVIGRLLLRVVIIGYSMTGLIIATQIVIVLLLIKIIRKVIPGICPSECSCCESDFLMNGANTSCSSSSDDCSPSPRKSGSYQRYGKKLKTLVKPRKFCRRPTRVKGCKSAILGQSVTSSPWTSDSSGPLTSSPSCEPAAESARIAPSAHLQHKLPQKHKGVP